MRWRRGCYGVARAHTEATWLRAGISVSFLLPRPVLEEEPLSGLSPKQVSSESSGSQHTAEMSEESSGRKWGGRISCTPRAFSSHYHLVSKPLQLTRMKTPGRSDRCYRFQFADEEAQVQAETAAVLQVHSESSSLSVTPPCALGPPSSLQPPMVSDTSSRPEPRTSLSSCRLHT